MFEDEAGSGLFRGGGVSRLQPVAQGREGFRQGAEAQRFVELLPEVTQGDGLTVFAWCLRGEAVVRVREALAIVGVERYGLRCVDLAKKMAKSPDSLTKAISRATRRRLKNPEYVSELDHLDEAVAKSGGDVRNGGTA